MTEKELIEKMLFEAKQDKPTKSVPSPTSPPSMGERIREVVSAFVRGIKGGIEDAGRKQARTGLPPEGEPSSTTFSGSITPNVAPKPPIEFKNVPPIEFKNVPPSGSDFRFKKIK
jgi:hypothetical protein